MIKKPFSTLIHSALLTAAFSLTVVACGGGGGTKTDTTPIVVTPADKVAPIITLAGDATVSHTQGTAYSDPGATAQDAVDGAVSVSVSGSVADSVGTYEITYSATDSAGNTATATRIINVIAAGGSNSTPVAIDTSKWFHQTQLPNGWGWFNNEQQHYTNRIDNAYVSDGTLKIVAKRETFRDQGQTKQFTSARLNAKYAFTYGRVEVRAKLPSGAGTWPAIWMLGQNINETGAYWQQQGFGTTGWPECGEIDIMEHWGNNQNYVQSALHSPSSYGGTFNVGGQYIGTVSSEFHVYSMAWTADEMVFSVDGNPHYTYAPANKDASTWPFDKPQYLLLNFAIQDNIFSSFVSDAMEVDYVRIYADGAAESDQPVWSDEFN